ncbi:MAG: tetratricopeptide repeat protein [Usitatibacter sp.]
MTPGSQARAHFDTAMEHARSGRIEAAVGAYRRALELRPDYFEALANLGNLLQRLQRRAEAIEAYRGALALRPGDVNLLTGLGTCELLEGRPKSAIPPLEEAIRLHPDFTAALNSLGVAVGKLGDSRRAIELFRRAVMLRPDFLHAWSNLGGHLQAVGEDAPAIAAFDRVLALDATNEEARFRRDSMAGNVVLRAPDGFVREVFDRYADEFDQRLTGDLGYRTPQDFGALIAPWLSAHGPARVLDLGCGTGLAGLHVRAGAARLVGVDLSGRMLERAAARGIYDELVEAEVVDFLDRCAPQSYDLVMALDVLVYIGNLALLLQSAARVLAPGSVIAFSTEDLVDTCDPYRLARTGRYSHSRGYVAEAAAAAGFTPVKEEAVVIRKEAGKPVNGRLFAFVGAERDAI